jgi:hypothetical protein
MIFLKTAFTWILGNLKAFLFILLIALSVAIYWLWQNNKALKVDNSRISENFEQKDKQVSQLNMTLAEYKNLQTKDKATVDSLLEVIKKKPKDLKEATVIRESFKDTNTIEPKYSPPIADQPKPNEQILSKPMYSIPISLSSDSDSCWGMKGIIKSTDPKARLFINERSFINSIQLLVIKNKKFLWWTIRKEQFKAFSDCGKELKVTKIKFVKKFEKP